MAPSAAQALPTWSIQTGTASQHSPHETVRPWGQAPISRSPPSPGRDTLGWTGLPGHLSAHTPGPSPKPPPSWSFRRPLPACLHSPLLQELRMRHLPFHPLARAPPHSACLCHLPCSPPTGAASWRASLCNLRTASRARFQGPRGPAGHLDWARSLRTSARASWGHSHQAPHGLNCSPAVCVCRCAHL